MECNLLPLLYEGGHDRGTENPLNPDCELHMKSLWGVHRCWLFAVHLYTCTSVSCTHYSTNTLCIKTVLGFLEYTCSHSTLKVLESYFSIFFNGKFYSLHQNISI